MLLTVVVVPLTVRSPPTTTAPLKVALPARAMSISRAVMADDPSVPLIAKFLSATLTVSSTSLELFAISKIDVPPSLNIMLAPSASSMMSAPASNVMSLELSISAMTGVVNVLFVKVCVAAKPTKVSVTAGMVIVTLPEKSE